MTEPHTYAIRTGIEFHPSRSEFRGRGRASSTQKRSRTSSRQPTTHTAVRLLIRVWVYMGRHILVTIATVFLPICLSAYLFVHASPSLLPHSFLDPHLSLWYGRSQCIFTIFGAALYEPKQESAAAVIRQPHRRTRSACSDNNPNPNNELDHACKSVTKLVLSWTRPRPSLQEYVKA